MVLQIILPTVLLLAWPFTCLLLLLFTENSLTGPWQNPFPSPCAHSLHNWFFHSWSAELSVQHQTIKETQRGISLMQRTFQKRENRNRSMSFIRRVTVPPKQASSSWVKNKKKNRLKEILNPEKKESSAIANDLQGGGKKRQKNYLVISC